MRCGYCTYLSRVKKLPRPLGINLAIGSSVHRAVEQARLLSQEPPQHDTLAALAGIDGVAADWFDQEVSAPTDPETGESLDAEIDLGSKFDSLSKAKDFTVALAQFTVPKILELDRQRGKVAAVEYNLSMLPSPYPFSVQGRLDCLYVDWLADASKPEDATIMADLKTASRLAPPDEYVALAQSIYAEFWSARGKSLTVLADVVSKARQPELQTYPLSIDDYGRDLVHQTVMEVAEDISAGRFRMRPNFTCPFLHGLPEFQIAVGGFPSGE